jgi:hypothetical protein
MSPRKYDIGQHQQNRIERNFVPGSRFLRGSKASLAPDEIGAVDHVAARGLVGRKPRQAGSETLASRLRREPAQGEEFLGFAYVVQPAIVYGLTDGLRPGNIITTQPRGIYAHADSGR